jgi:lipopolysaccharide export system protein LptC
LTVAPHIHDREPAVFAAGGRRDDRRLFRAAQRHSRSVRLLRIGIPLCIVAAIAVGAIVTMWVKPLSVLAKVPVDMSSVAISGTKITMQAPRVAGYTSDNRQYEMTAQIAAQDITKTDTIELQGIRASMEMQDRTTFETTASSGIYNTKTEQLMLQENVLVTTSSGYQARLAEAQVDIKGGRISSEKPVEVRTLDWLISANRMEVADSGGVIKFERGVSVTLMGGVEFPRMDANAGPASNSRKR